ncbi:unnamed protein product [Cercospora beticola]|nr:unnamed protein product [Cercospora beticola]
MLEVHWVTRLRGAFAPRVAGHMSTQGSGFAELHFTLSNNDCLTSSTVGKPATTHSSTSGLSSCLQHMQRSGTDITFASTTNWHYGACIRNKFAVQSRSPAKVRLDLEWLCKT